MAADKVILITTFSGRKVYIQTTEEKWKELTQGVEVFSGYYVTGWHLNQDKVGRVAHGEYPEREDYHVMELEAWDEKPTPDYYINYSSFDKPERTQ